jgi:hypothetical protein
VERFKRKGKQIMKNITITVEEHNMLKKDRMLVDAFMAVGIERWRFYDVAMLMVKKLEEQTKENEIKKEIMKKEINNEHNT